MSFIEKDSLYAVLIWSLLFSLLLCSYSVIPWVVTSEIFPLEVRGWSLSIQCKWNVSQCYITELNNDIHDKERYKLT